MKRSFEGREEEPPLLWGGWYDDGPGSDVLLGEDGVDEDGADEEGGDDDGGEGDGAGGGGESGTGTMNRSLAELGGEHMTPPAAPKVSASQPGRRSRGAHAVMLMGKIRNEVWRYGTG
jgi:hypothetical protein